MKFTLGGDLKCDLELLAERKLLIQASPGGGKSRTIRRIAEQTHGKIQQIIIDPEGELVTLREKFDYVIAAAADGDTQAHPRSAALLAETLLKLEASAICDLYELKPPQRIDFVKRFFEALVNAPKKLWHPVLLFLDEGQMFAPEGVKCESTSAVIDEATRGRKRGQSLIVATQRISMLDKNVAAALHNKLIGFTSLDTDLKRAAFELGFDKQQMLTLRDLPSMHFWAFGPAIARAPTLVEIGPHVTSHPKSGARLTAPMPPPTDRIRALLPKLADLPAEAEQRTRTLQELQRDNATLRGQLTRLERAAPTRVETKVETKVRRVEVPVLKDGQVQRLERAATKLADAGVAVTTIGRELVDALKKFHHNGKVPPLAVQPSAPRGAHPVRAPQPARQPAPPVDGEFRASSSQQRILDALAWLAVIGLAPANKNQLAFLAGQRSTSGGYFNNLGVLRSAGLITYPQAGTVELTPAGVERAAVPERPPSVEELHREIQAKVSRSQWAILAALIAVYPESVTKDELAEQAGQRATSGGYFNNLGTLRTLGLIDYPSPRRAVALPVLFLEEATR